MLAYLVRGVRRTSTALLANDTPHQLALGFAVGMVLGLMPKGNLVALSLCVLLFSLRVNTGLALLAVMAFSCCATLVDPFAEKLGQAVLSADALQTSYSAMFQLPLGPWIGFHNTVVTGSLLVGLYLAYPVYWLCFVAARRLQVQGAGSSERNADTIERDEIASGSALYRSADRGGRRVA
jgi:uncharacterized protein (TIGR03546 family)